MSLVAKLMQDEPDRWLSILTDTYKVKAVHDGGLVSLKYNQIESPMHEPIVQECRGLVVDVARRQVLAFPYRKFWNHGEPLADAIDWSTASVLEKLDGSLMTLYWHPDRGWTVASSGTPLAGGQFGDTGETFAEAFWRTWHALGRLSPMGHRCLPPATCQRVSFMFEFCDAPNRIIVRHEAPRIVLHGARYLDSGREWTANFLECYARTIGWECVKSYPITSIDQCLAAADALDPIACEGFVVVDAAFNRVKIKSPRYVALHHMKGDATERRAIQLWQTGETAEVLAHFPEFAPVILPVQARLFDLACDAAQAVNQNAGVTRKQFAEAVKAKPFAAVAFKMFGGIASATQAAEIMRGQTVQALERMLGGVA